MQPQGAGLLSLPSYASASKSRLQALYSDILPQKTANPAAFHANVEWWRGTLEAFVEKGLQGNSSDRLILHASRSLMDALRVDGVGKPIGLGTAVTELLQAAPNVTPPLPALIPKSAFFSLRQSIYTPTSIMSTLPSLIASYLIAKPLWWALEQMGIVGQDGIFSTSDSRKWEGEYVVLALLERAAESVSLTQKTKASGPGDALYTIDTFRQEFSTCVGLAPGDILSRTDADVLLRYLERDKQSVVSEKEVIKFTAAKEAGSITAVDKGILELKLAVSNMQTQVDQLHAKVGSLTERASEALKQQRKPLALSCIRSRKHVQELLNKRLTALDNLETTLLSVETAAGDVELMETYAHSTATLKTILSHPALQRGSIDETMDALAEANADAKDIDEAIRDGANVAGDITFDEAELQEELDGLLQEKMAEDEAVEIARKHAQQEVPQAQQQEEKVASAKGPNPRQQRVAVLET